MKIQNFTGKVVKEWNS